MAEAPEVLLLVLGQAHGGNYSAGAGPAGS
jgi:hypothetical protein